MNPTLLIAVSVGVGAAALVGSIAMLFQGKQDSVAEDRLVVLAGVKGRGKKKSVLEETSLLSQPLESNKTAVEDWLNEKFNIQRALDQADMRMSVLNFAVICLGGAFLTFSILIAVGAPFYIAPVVALLVLVLPFFYLDYRRNNRLMKFNKQLPEALELLSRSLRAGHSLGAGFGLIAGEMPNPISREFGRCFEEQNFGIALEESLNNMTNRIPNMDLRFLATAIILQRQTGGDLAEILDKISHLIRERFKLAGQIQALTGEGRLSGVVLFALPPGLFVTMYFLNREYIMSIFNDSMGRWMLGGAIVMQLMGAFVIRKIVDIKV